MTKSKKIFKIIAIILLVLVVLFAFLIAPRTFKKPDLSAFEGAYIAHRGYFDNESDAPENSLPSFELAAEKGLAIELDIQLSSDGVPMVFHDADLDRVCGVEGKIWDFTAAELKEMKLMGTEETIPTFEEALALIDGRVPVLVEYKMDKVDTAVCANAQALLDSYEGEYAVQAFDPRAVLWYKKNAPEVPRGQLAKEFWHEEEYNTPLYTVLSFLVGNVATRPDFVSYNYEHQDNIALKAYRLLGGKTACWTLRAPEAYEEVKNSGFDMYIFDSFDLTEYAE